MRTPMVTRTIMTTKVSVLCMDTETAEALNIDMVLPRTYKDDKEMLKAVKKAMADKENIVPAKVVYSEVVETLYGMTELEFINHAEVLPPRAINGKDGE